MKKKNHYSAVPTLENRNVTSVKNKSKFVFFEKFHAKNNEFFFVLFTFSNRMMLHKRWERIDTLNISDSFFVKYEKFQYNSCRDFSLSKELIVISLYIYILFWEICNNLESKYLTREYDICSYI